MLDAHCIVLRDSEWIGHDMGIGEQRSAIFQEVAKHSYCGIRCDDGDTITASGLETNLRVLRVTRLGPHSGKVSRLRNTTTRRIQVSC